jgi:hypothetical protein
MMNQSTNKLVIAALNMLRSNKNYVEDAIEYAPLGNSFVGSILSLQHKAPRRYAEAAVRAALHGMQTRGEIKRPTIRTM